MNSTVNPKISADRLCEKQISGQTKISPRSPSRLVPRAVSTTPTQPKAHRASAVSLLWFHSTRNLDFCLLALCSCLLAVLCHQAVVIPGTSSAASSMASSTATNRATQLNFLLKAGLFTGKGQPEIEEEST